MKRIAFVVCGLFACGDDAEPSAETEVTTPEVIEEAETEVAETEVGDVAETEVAETEVSAETADAEVTPDAPDTDPEGTAVGVVAAAVRDAGARDVAPSVDVLSPTAGAGG